MCLDSLPFTYIMKNQIAEKAHVFRFMATQFITAALTVAPFSNSEFGNLREVHVKRSDMLIPCKF